MMQRIAQSSIRVGALPKQPSFIAARSIFSTAQLQSNTVRNDKQSKDASKQDSTSEHHKPHQAKTVAQADEELRQRLEEMSGEGGAAGLEYEDGKPHTMKRSVRNNMFRYI
ncbi:hypothetical protein BDW74DRAFT_80163 [Aspergillus multicolor]|uniref:uncharacterized protein n=1 Tax=Aspergillus multicolor TaxID=41759 RepID=UPI003CCE2C75